MTTLPILLVVVVLLPASQAECPRTLLSASVDGLSSLFAADVTGDNTQDIVAASSFDGLVSYFPNADGFGTYGTLRIVGACDRARTVVAVDFDDDSDVDLLATCTSTVTLFRNQGGGQFSPGETLVDGLRQAWSLTVGDVDGLGSDADVVYGDRRLAGVKWRNTDTGVITVVTTDIPGPLALALADGDGDGDMDIFAAAGNSFYFLRNTDGVGGVFAAPVVLTSTAFTALTIAVGDIDGDGHVDVVGGSRYGTPATLVWFRNNATNPGDFSPLLPISVFGDGGPADVDGASSIDLADIDNDGSLDVLSVAATKDRAVWFRNVDGSGNFTLPNGTSSAALVHPEGVAPGAAVVLAVDVDNNNDVDVVVGSQDDDSIMWYRNIDGVVGVGVSHSVAFPVVGASAVTIGEISADGLLDVSAASASGIAMFMSDASGDAGHFDTPPAGLRTPVDAVSVTALDLDADTTHGALDLMASLSDGQVIVYRRESTNVWRSFLVTTDAASTAAPAAGDVAGDGGGADVVTVSALGVVSLHHNAAGDGSSWAATVVGTGHHTPTAVLLADVSGDGVPDVIVASTSGTTSGSVYWYRTNRPALSGGSVSFGARTLVASVTGSSGLTVSLAAADFDMDGRMDVAVGYEDTVEYLPNTDGSSFGDAVSVAFARDVSSLLAADIDGDSVVDLLWASAVRDMVQWAKNYGGGAFNGSVVITSATNAPTGSLAVGDLDGDGVVDVAVASMEDNSVAFFANVSRCAAAAAATVPPPDGSNSNDFPTAAVAGGVAGGVVFIVIVVVAAVVISRRRQVPDAPRPSDPALC